VILSDISQHNTYSPMSFFVKGIGDFDFAVLLPMF